MAEVTGLRNVVTPGPVYGLPYGVVFPIFDADGDFVSGAAGLDSEISLNGDTAADCANEATEIATSTGLYYLLLTAAEMTTNAAIIQVKTSTSGAKATPIALQPKPCPVIRTGTAQGGAAGSITLDAGASAVDNTYAGLVCYISSGTGNGQVRRVTGYTGSSKQAAVTPNWATNPDATSVFSLYLYDVWAVQNANVAQWLGATAPANSGDAYARLGAPAGASVSADIAAVKSDTGAIKAKTDNLPADPADDSDIDAQLASIAGYIDTEVATILAAVDTEVAAIKAKTDYLPSAAAGANGGLPTVDASNAVKVQSGTGANQISLVSGAVALQANQDVRNVSGSVDGAVGSVTGNVGGNVVGSVGSVAAGVTVSDKTGFKLASDGLDSISTAAPAGVAGNFREMVVQTWRRLFGKVTMTSTQIKTYANDGTTVVTTQTVGDDGTTQTQGAAS